MKANLNKINELKQLKNEKIIRMEEITNNALTEVRAMSDDETNEYEKLEGEVRALSATLDKCINAYEKEIENKPEQNEEYRAEKAEEKALLRYIRSGEPSEEVRADSNFTLNNNGAVIPTRILNRIFENVKERCTIFASSEIFTMGGTLSLPKYDESSGKISMAYADEFSTLTATSAKFESVELEGHLAAALTKVSKSLLNNSDFDLLSYIIDKVSESVADFIEDQLLNGTTDKITGLSDVEVVGTTVNADGLIDLQDSVKLAYQKNCKWIMNSATKNKIRKFKDNEGNYLLVRDYSKDGSNYTLLGKPIELTDALDDDTIYYGDFTGLKTKVTEGGSIEVLREVFALEHAIGIVAWIEIDSKLVEGYKIKAIKAAKSSSATTK